MLEDKTLLNPKGHVKLEIYDENGVYNTLEKRNLVVLGANEIIAKRLSDPTKTITLTHKTEGETNVQANDNGHFVFELDHKPESIEHTTIEVSASNAVKVFSLNASEEVLELQYVKTGESDLIVDEDVFIKDPFTGLIEFKTPPTEKVEVEYRMVSNKQAKIVPGSEVVTVNETVLSKSNTPDSQENKYAIDYKTGEIYLTKLENKVSVTYSVVQQYGIGFMALGGRPDGHPANKPVAFSESDKVLNHMENEIPNSRSPILYPAPIEEGKPEIDLLMTKSPEVEKETFEYTADNEVNEFVINTNYRRLIKLDKVVKKTGEDEEELEIGTDISILDKDRGVLKLTENLQENDSLVIIASLEKNKNHLIYELSLSPVVELVSVVHEDSESGAKKAFEVKERGMKVGSGDVWLLNANTGVLQFKAVSSTGASIYNPGQLTIEYRVNAGKTVKFVADFPKGTPGPIKTEKVETFTSSGEVTFVLSEEVLLNKDGIKKVTVNGEDRDYTLQPDNRRIEVDGVLNGDTVVVEYFYNKDTHEVYQVAMFDHKDSELSTMFNIAGLGPITKDKNSGIRVTWSVTF